MVRSTTNLRLARAGLPLLLLVSMTEPGAAARKARKEEVPADGKVHLEVHCTTPGATVAIDGEPVGTTPLAAAIAVAPGQHSIKVFRLGYAPYLEVFDPKGRWTIGMEIELVPVLGVLKVSSAQPGSRVLVDGRYVGDAPIDVEVDPGPRAVQVSKPGYKDFFENVMSVAGQDTPLSAALEELPPEVNPYAEKAAPPPRWYQKKWVWGVISGVGLVAIGGAVTGGVLGSQNQDPLSRADFAFDLAK